MYHPTTRVLTVLELLQSRPRLSGPELAARLEVDGRTVRRYITMLQDMGIPVEAERGRYGAYRLRPGYKLPPLMFADDEALAVVLGLRAARRLGLAAAAPAAEGALAKVERVLPAPLRDQIQALQEVLTLDLPPVEASPAGEALLTVAGAAGRQRRVWLRYRALHGQISEREIDPYGVVYRTGRWYTVGYCHLRQDRRLFRLDRMLRVEERPESFERPGDLDPLAFVLRALALTPDEWAVEVELTTTLAAARERVSPALATLEETPGGVRLRCNVADLDWLAGYLLGLPWPLRVIRPPELRAELRRLGERALTLAENPAEPLARQS